MKKMTSLSKKHRPVLLLSALICIFLQISCSTTPISKPNSSFSSSRTTYSLLDQILSKKVIRVGTTGDYSPYTYQLDGPSNSYHGIDIELAKDLAKSLGVEVQFVKTTWSNLLKDLTANRFDIGMGGITVTLDRQKQVLFSMPVAPGGKAAITRDESVTRYNTISKINQPGVRVIVNPGGTNEIFTKANFPQATIILNEDNITIFQKIVDREADVMVTDAVETLVQQLIHPELEAVNPKAPFNFFEKGYLLPRDHTFKAFVDQWVNLRLKDGTYQRIFDAELEQIRKRASTE